MKLKIEPTFIAVIGLSLLTGIGFFSFLVDRRDTDIVHRLADRNFQVVSRAAVEHINTVANEAGMVLKGLKAESMSGVPLSSPMPRLIDAADRLSDQPTVETEFRAANVFAQDLADGLNALVGSDEQVVVFNKEGEALLSAGDMAHPALLAAAKQAMRDNRDSITALGSDQGQSFDVSGEDKAGYRVSIHRVGEEVGFPWLMAVVASHDSLFAEAKRLHRDIFFWGAGLLAVGLAFSYFFARAFTRPIRLLDEEAQRIASFDLDAGRALPESRIFEISDLSRTMTAMRSGIDSFGRFVPKVLVRDLVASGREPAIGGERRELTVMFSDIADFTPISEGTSPEVLMTRMSDYLSALALQVHQHEGTVDKFIGDSLMAFWNAPDAEDDHPNKAADGVLAARAAALALNETFVAQGFAPLQTRFGLHLGDAVVGFLGGGDRLQYTAIGGTVNLASRVEGLNKYYGTEILVTEPLAKRLDSRFLTRLVGRAKPVGVSQPIGLYELMGYAENTVAAQRADLWGEAIGLYYDRSFKAAGEAMTDFLTLWPNERLALHYRDKALQYDRCGVVESWDGVDRFVNK